MSNDEQQYAERSRGGPPPTLIALVVIVVVAIVFVLQNRERTTIDFLFFEVNSRVWVAIAIALALGVVLDRVLQSWWRRRRNRE